MSNFKMNIRKLKKDDISYVIELLQSLSVFTVHSSKINKIWEIYSEQNFVHSRVVESDDKIIGFGSLKMWWQKIIFNILLSNYLYITTDNSVAFSPDGKLLASVAQSKKPIKLWNIENKQCIHTFDEHEDSVCSVAFSPDGKLLASGSWDRTIKLWDVETKACIHTFNGHMGPVYSVTFSSDGNSLVSGSKDQTIKLWDVGRFNK